MCASGVSLSPVQSLGKARRSKGPFALCGVDTLIIIIIPRGNQKITALGYRLGKVSGTWGGTSRDAMLNIPGVLVSPSFLLGLSTVRPISTSSDKKRKETTKHNIEAWLKGLKADGDGRSKTDCRDVHRRCRAQCMASVAFFGGGAMKVRCYADV